MNSHVTKIREFYQLSQYDLAQLLETSRSDIAMLEGYQRTSISVSLNKRFLLLEQTMHLDEKQGVNSEKTDDFEKNNLTENTLIHKFSEDLSYKLMKEERALKKILYLRLMNQRAKKCLEDIFNSFNPEEVEDFMYQWLPVQIRTKAEILGKIDEAKIRISKVKIAGFKAMIKELESF